MTYKAIVKMGHMGTGKFREETIYVDGETIMDAFDAAKWSPGVKHKSTSVLLLEAVI